MSESWMGKADKGVGILILYLRVMMGYSIYRNF